MKKDLPLEGYLKPLKRYLDRPDMVELVFNREGEVGIEDTHGKWTFIKDKNITREVFENLASYLANKTGQKFNANVPRFSGRLPNYGYRLQICAGAMVESGIAVTMRVASATKFPLESYMNQSKADELKELIKMGKTMLICAGTGMGKTTLLNSMLEHIPLDCRIITLQDTPELVVPHHNLVSYIKSKTDSDIAGLKYKDFMNMITRMRPDRILLGEIDTDNVWAFLKLCNSGHSGSISTIHAEDGQEALNALCINVLMSGETNASPDIIRQFAVKAIDYFVFINKTITDKGRVFSADFISTQEVLNGF